MAEVSIEHNFCKILRKEKMGKNVKRTMMGSKRPIEGQKISGSSSSSGSDCCRANSRKRFVATAQNLDKKLKPIATRSPVPKQ
jgi:hypothetical protein